MWGTVKKAAGLDAEGKEETTGEDPERQGKSEAAP